MMKIQDPQMRFAGSLRYSDEDLVNRVLAGTPQRKTMYKDFERQVGAQLNMDTVVFLSPRPASDNTSPPADARCVYTIMAKGKEKAQGEFPVKPADAAPKGWFKGLLASALGKTPDAQLQKAYNAVLRIARQAQDES